MILCLTDDICANLAVISAGLQTLQAVFLDSVPSQGYLARHRYFDANRSCRGLFFCIGILERVSIKLHIVTWRQLLPGRPAVKAFHLHHCVPLQHTQAHKQGRTDPASYMHPLSHSHPPPTYTHTHTRTQPHI
ncbi:unnamed protein product [Protopolystoma xenopodis]|uniref:Uncharacterized protein n=1 Tax=Protopolystoma xenopodis TaxID=117903 RepID=A0A448WLJ5_9PLAT|nr:unnamed protein product [Protopolystoma xenopodis]